MSSISNATGFTHRARPGFLRVIPISNAPLWATSPACGTAKLGQNDRSGFGRVKHCENPLVWHTRGISEEAISKLFGSRVPRQPSALRLSRRLWLEPLGFLWL
jgi:hypothetical protein